MCTDTLSFGETYVRCQKSLGVPQYRTEPKGAEGESTLLSSLHDSGIDLLLTVASRVYPCSVLLLSSLIVVLGVLRSYTMFFGVRIYISSLWPWLCHNIFNVVRIALLYLPLSFSFFTSAYFGCSSLIRCFTVALDVSGCSRCCAVDQCWLLLRYETVIRVLRDFVVCTRNRHESVSRSATPSLAKNEDIANSLITRAK